MNENEPSDPLHPNPSKEYQKGYRSGVKFRMKTGEPFSKTIKTRMRDLDAEIQDLSRTRRLLLAELELQKMGFTLE